MLLADTQSGAGTRLYFKPMHISGYQDRKLRFILFIIAKQETRAAQLKNLRVSSAKTD
jgi:hypothetical protein